MRNREEQVLVAEDDANDRYFIMRALESAGMTRPAQIVENGRKAIDYLEGIDLFGDRSRFPYPDFILTDLKMPVASGFEVLEWLKAHPELRVIPTVVFSSSADPEDIKRAHCLGASAYMCKPVDPAEFKDLMSRLVRFWEVCQRPVRANAPSCEELVDGPL